MTRKQKVCTQNERVSVGAPKIVAGAPDIKCSWECGVNVRECERV